VKALSQAAQKEGKSVSVHLKVDTGMTRLGLLPEEIAPFLDRLKQLPAIRPVGLISHLADADDREFSKRQLASFEKARLAFENRFPSPFLHIANSLSVLDRRYTNYDAVRVGIALYGSYPVRRQSLLRQSRGGLLRPVMSWKSSLLSVKRVPKGTAVSYGMTYRTKRSTQIGVVPVGYADGYPRILSNRAEVLVHGVRVPVAGTICMDMFMVDLGGVRHPKPGNEVVLLGSQGREKIRQKK
jgi:alanine racemase